MGKRRRIVPDASVILPGLFQETIQHRGNPFNLTQRAKPLVDAVRRRAVLARAPDVLIHEFTKWAHEKTSARKGAAGLDTSTVERQLFDFLSLEITYEPASRIARIAWGLMRNHQISPPDSWYLACAIRADAELWISHEHKDGFARNARKIHRKVHLLTEEKFT